MADIESLIAGSGRTNADWNAIPGIATSYWEGLDQKQKNAERNVFKGGVPTNPDGSPNYGEMSKSLFQLGNVGSGTGLANLDIARQQLALGQKASASLGAVEGGDAVPTTAPTISPSMSRPNGTIDPKYRDQSVGGQAPQAAAPGAAPTATKGGQTLMQVVAASGIPNDQLGAVSESIGRQIGVDPTQPIDLQDSRVRNVLVPALQRFKNIGQPVPQGAPVQQGAPSAPPAPEAPNPVDTRGSLPTDLDPNIQKRAALYTSIVSNPAYPQATRDAAKMRLEALQKNSEMTGPQKEYAQARQQGFKGTLQDFMAETESRKTGATEEAKIGAQKYANLVESGVKAQTEIPQLEMLQEQMNDPNFYSGAGEKYSLLAKRLKAAVGIDPNAAVPQEFLRKATAASVLASFGALKGLGPIRVAEMNLAKTAAAAPENSIPANKLLVEIQKRTYQKQSDVADMAQAYKEKNGSLDAGFDRQVTQYMREHPMFSETEVKNWHKAIGEPGAPPMGAMKFTSPGDVHAAVAAGKLKKGNKFTDPNGVERMVP